jgi:DNA polymerase-3 subunit alpha
MGKKDPKVMAKQREAFLEGARAKGVNEKKAVKLFELIEFFAGYGFNKAHATAYAWLAYQTAYLKANYPWHFAAALFTIEAQNTDKLALYISEARERGIPVLPPSINESALNFTVEPGKGVRFGLTAIKGLGEGAVNAIIAVRKQLGGRIPSLHALCETIDLRIANKRVFEALVKSGACDSLIAPVGRSLSGPPGELDKARPTAEFRARLFAAIDAACEHGARTQRDNDLGQTQLFGGDDHAAGSGSASALPAAAAWTEIEQLQHEKDALGLYWSGHPVDRYAEALREYGAKTTGDLSIRKAVGEDEVGTVAPSVNESANGNGHGNTNGNGIGNGIGHRTVEDISIGGIVAGLRPLKTRKGDRMCVITLDDAQGSVEAVVFPEAFKQYGHLAEEGQMVLVKGKLERDDESARLLVSEIAPLGIVTERLASSVAITLSTPQHDRETFVQLWDVLMRHKGDRRVAIELRDSDHHLRVKLDINAQIRVRPSERLVSEVEKICGTGSVSLR